MAATISVTSRSHLPSGEVLVRGTCTLDALYATGGETRDLSTHLGGSPTVIYGGDDGYVLQDNRGTAAAGLCIAYRQDPTGNAAGALSQVAVNTNLAAVVSPFLAIGVTV